MRRVPEITISSDGGGASYYGVRWADGTSARMPYRWQALACKAGWTPPRDGQVQPITGEPFHFATKEQTS